MRITIIGPLPPPNGGIATWLSELINYENSQLLFDVVDSSNSTIGKDYLSKKRKFSREFKRFMRVKQELKRSVKVFKPDVIHLNTSCSVFGLIRDYFLIRKYKKMKIVLHCHCNIADQVTKISSSFFKKICAISSRIIVLNKKSFDYVYNNCSQSAVILPNFIIDSCVHLPLVNLKLKNIIFVGNIIKTKGINEIIDCSRYFKDINFTLVGAISNEFLNIDLPENVKFIGSKSREEIIHLLCKNDLFLFPSYTEGFSIALLEAMACGLPCIATDVGANRDMLEDFGGCIVEKENVAQICDAINLMRDYSVRKKCSEWNLKKVKQTYLVDCVFQKLVGIYNELFD